MRVERLSAQPKKVPLECRRACRLMRVERLSAQPKKVPSRMPSRVRDGFMLFIAGTVALRATDNSNLPGWCLPRNFPVARTRDVPVRYSAVPDSRLPRTQLPASSADRCLFSLREIHSAPAEVSGDFFRDLPAVGNSPSVHRHVSHVSWKKSADTSFRHGD